MKIQGYDSLLSVTEVEDFFIWSLSNEGFGKSVNYDYQDRKLRQFIKKSFLENGSFYIFSPKLFRKNNNRLGGNIGFKIMDKHKMFQIDNVVDLQLCEVIMRGYHLDKL